MPLKKELKQLALASAFIVPSLADAGATSFQRPDLPMDRALWAAKSNDFECKISLPMDELGTLEIRHMAGANLETAYLPVREARNRSSVKWVNAPWHKDASGKSYSMARNSGGYKLGASATRKLMAALDEGSWTSIKFDGKDLLIPSIYWSEASNEFHACRKVVSPLSIAQARDQNLYYSAGQRTISENHLQMIADTARYIELDPEVTRVLVDSYTDKGGNRLANLQLSRERTADVVAALKEAGVDGDIIQGRSHGERLTVQKDNSQRSRNLARKVTIRIIRGPLPEPEEEKTEESEEPEMETEESGSEQAVSTEESNQAPTQNGMEPE